MSGALEGFELYTKPSAAKPVKDLAAQFYVKTVAVADGYFGLNISTAVMGIFDADQVAILFNTKTQQLALRPVSEGGAHLAPLGVNSKIKRISITVLARQLGLQPGIRMPARVVDGVLFIDYSGAVAPAALSAVAG